MKRHHAGFVSISLVSLAVLAAGCADQVSRDQSYANQRIAGASRDQAMEVAQLVFRQYFSIDRVDTDEGCIYSRPSEVRESAPPERVRDVLTRTPNRRRQVAELRVATRGGEVIASCRVRVQRLDTSERRAFAPQTGDDRPANNAPFSAEAGTSARQSEDWVDVGRNRQLEQQVLASLRDRLNPPAATQPADAR